MSDQEERKKNPKKIYAMMLLILAAVIVLIFWQQGYLFCRGAGMKRNMVIMNLHFLYMTEGIRGILRKVFFGVCLLVIVHMVLSTVAQEIANQNTEVITERAKVLRRRTLVDYDNFTRQPYGYLIYFETPSEEKLEIRVTKQIYNMMKPGDRGMLTRKGTRFCGFEPENKDIQ